MKTFSITDTGVLRTMNQDYCFSSDTPIGNLPNLYIVCDGMGGHKAGEYASRYTAQRIVAHASRSRSENPIRILRDAVQKANEILVIESREDVEKQGMGTTVVAATVYDHKMYVANVGDSRLYVVNDTIKQITTDHSYVEEMIKRGNLQRENARSNPNKNIITRAVGAKNDIQADIYVLELKPGDLLLMCSDGLSNMLEDEEMRMIIKRQRDIVEMAEKLVEAANENGGKDNISVILIDPFADEVNYD